MKTVKRKTNLFFYSALAAALLMAGCSSTTSPEPQDNKEQGTEKVSDESQTEDKNTDSESEKIAAAKETEKDESKEESQDALNEVKTTEDLVGVWEVTNFGDLAKTFTFNSDGTYEIFMPIEADQESDNLRSGTFNVENGVVNFNELAYKVGNEDLSFLISEPNYGYKASTDGKTLLLEGLNEDDMTYFLEKTE